MSGPSLPDLPDPASIDTSTILVNSVFFLENGFVSSLPPPTQPIPSSFEYKGPPPRNGGLLEQLREQKTYRENNPQVDEAPQEQKDPNAEPIDGVQQHQKLFNEYLKKRIKKIKAVHNYLTDQEIITAIDKCGHDEDEATARLTDFFFLNDIRKDIALKEQEKENRVKGNGNNSQTNDVNRQIRIKSSTSPTKKQTRHNRKLRLDDALKQDTFEGWSEARIKAYKLIDKNPNAYYYRFNPPGEEQRNGKWEKQEKELFFQQMKKLGVNSQWGIFSMAIPGRVGYQCSNFYRHLIETGEIVDPNYMIDEKGKVHYLFSKGVAKKPRKNKGGDDDKDSDQPTIVSKKRKRSRKGKKKGDEEEDDDDDDFTPSVSCRRQTEEGETLMKNSNPLPGFLDPITCEEIEQPAISPYGHVMGKKTWARCLTAEPRNVCPFTKQPCSIRDLVLLTWENIDEHRDKIVNAD